MTQPRERRPWLRAAGFGAAALAMTVAACEAPGPVQPAPVGTSMQPVRTESGMEVVAVSSNVRISRAAIENAVRTHYPAVLSAATTDTSTLMFVLAENGGIERHERLQMKRMGAAPPAQAGESPTRWRQSTGLSERDAERSVVDVVTFQPGQMGPGRVDVLWVRKLSQAELAVTADTRGERMRQPGPEQRKQEDPEWEISREQAREHVVRYFPQVVRGEVTPQTVWIIADARGQVVAYGDDRNDEPLQRQSDDIDNVQVFKGENLTFNGHEVGLVYVRLKG